MAYFFPILKAPGCSGWTIVYNFSPNNWEGEKQIARYLSAVWPDGESWRSKDLGIMSYGAVRRVAVGDLLGVVPENRQVFLALTDVALSATAPTLVDVGMPFTSYPNWRATLGLTSLAGTEVAYQGEIHPFPVPGSLLTFGHLLQFGDAVENYLLFVNIERCPEIRSGKLEIRNSAEPEKLLREVEVQSNGISVASLDGLGFTASDLPLVLCNGMSAIPLYFSRTKDGSFLSLEHTHPPASSVVYGKRLDAHKHLKKIWFSKASAR